jgi:hypothetical protein
LEVSSFVRSQSGFLYQNILFAPESLNLEQVSEKREISQAACLLANSSQDKHGKDYMYSIEYLAF